MDETKFDWVDDGDGTLSARYGSLFFMVTPHADDQWTARVSVKGVAIYDESFDGRDAAIRWCGRRLPEIVDPLVATARAEAALAEREALVFYVDRALRDALGGVFRTAYVLAVADAFRARTTPATLSTETLAAIAEARGLRVVEPGLLAGIDATALATAERERDEARAELASVRADLAALTERVETEIPAACAAVRERAIEECVAAALTHTIAPGLALSEPDADPTQVALARVVHRAVTAVVDTLRALAASQPAPVDSLDVDPAAGALR